MVMSPFGNRLDDYYWLRDDSKTSKASEIIDYLSAENEFTRVELIDTKLREEILLELLRKAPRVSRSFLQSSRNHWYWMEQSVDAEHPKIVRTTSLDIEITVLIDLKVRARDSAYFRVGSFCVSPDEKYIAWTEDTKGNRTHTLCVMSLHDGRVLPHEVYGVLENIVWDLGSRHIFYIFQNPKSLQSGTVRVHDILLGQNHDQDIYSEADDGLFVEISLSSSKHYLLLTIHGLDTSEVLAADLTSIDYPMSCIIPRTPNVLSFADHSEDYWIIRRRDHGSNFGIFIAAEGRINNKDLWQILIAGNQDAHINAFKAVGEYIAIEVHQGSRKSIRVMNGDGATCFNSELIYPSLNMSLTSIAYDNTDQILFTGSSLINPEIIFGFSTVTKEVDTKVVDKLDWYEQSLYAEETILATSKDGTKVPISIAYRKKAGEQSVEGFLYITAYGAYGVSKGVKFDSNIFSLLDRGFVYAVAHVRGGGEYGSEWHDGGRLLSKWNSIYDTLDCMDELIREGYTKEGNIFASGRSAGGLLAGVLANVAGCNFRALALHVPFVDAVTTMLDASIPLTSNEWAEWGNPILPEHYRYILSYSPYDNICAREYPAMLVTASLWDSQVQYFEPAKYVAKLRATKTDNNLLLLSTDLHAGHAGASGRCGRLSDVATEFAFFLMHSE